MVTLHPFVGVQFTCAEHPVNASVGTDHARGIDCTVARFAGGAQNRLMALHANDGSRNEDWYGWREPLLAPFAGTVVRVHLNPVTNVPGVSGDGAPSSIAFARADGVHVAYTHVMDVVVRVGDSVAAGQPVARVGNDGESRSPHTHITAWRDSVQLQIRFDGGVMERLRRRR